jgi:WD40 repeat protein
VLRQIKGIRETSGFVFSNSGRIIGSLGPFPSATFYDLHSGRELISLNDVVDSIRFSPDDRRVVTTRQDGTAVIWDAQVGKELASLKGHTALVHTAEFSPDGKRIVTSSADRSVRLWDAQDGRQLARLPCLASSASFSSNGDYLVTQGDLVRIWPLNREAAAKMTFVRHETWVSEQLSLSAGRGDLFAWQWQMSNWYAKLDPKDPDLQGSMEKATKSPNAMIASEARKRVASTGTSSTR